jgi:hypothetical protein
MLKIQRLTTPETFVDVADIFNFPVYMRTGPNPSEWEIVDARVETLHHTVIFSIKYSGIVLDDDSGEKVQLV